MEENKLTDEDIVKALDFCYSSPCCGSGCPYFNKHGRNFCVEDKALYKDMKRIVLEHAEQKTEIERLTELQSRGGYRVAELSIENAELQKQVAELKEQRDVFKKLFKSCNNSSITESEIIDAMNSFYREQAEHLAGLKIEQAVKDTAKEIFDSIFETLCVFTTEGKSEEYNEGFLEAVSEIDERLQKLAKEKGVEVE